MSGWLRNIQGQLSDLANEVLNEASEVLTEAREEVPDPDGEIIVAKKKCAEAEKQLAIEMAKVESLSSEKEHLEQQLYDAHVEMDAIGSKLNGMVKQRDEEIKKLKNQMEHIEESGWHETTPTSFPSATETSQITELRQQIAHWKAKAENGENSGIPDKNQEEMVRISEMERKIEALRQQKEHEIQSIVESHAESMVEMREMYEEKISNMQIHPYNASSSTSNADVLDAVLLEKEDLKSTRSTNGSDGEGAVVVDLGSHDELVDERIRHMEHELERAKIDKMDVQRSLESKLEGLQEQNKELADAYTELNTEFEQFKQQNNVVVNANSDLNRRIDSLKANLIEYEERYELCKKENAETVAQLERLSNDFARLRTGVANVSQRRDDCDLMVNEEVEKLRNALDESRSERERLRDDVQRFQVAVGEIDVELEKLRAANRQLLEENNALTENLTRYDETMKSIISSSEEDIGKFREQFHEIQENHKKQREAMNAENDALREETEAIKRQRDILMEESTLLKDVNEKLKTKTSAEEEKNRLLQEKSDLLEQCLSKERAERAAYNEKSEEAKRETEAKILNSDCDGNLENENSVLKLQLKEALDANAEKTDECEKLIIENRSLEREVDLRQNCVDEMIAQTNTLQMQQESMSTQNKTLQTQILAHERSIVQLEERLAEEQERSDELAKKTKRLEEVIVGGDSSGKDGDDENDDEQSRGSEAKSEELVKFKRYVAELQTKLSETENELKLIKEQKAAENTEAAEIRENLERNLFEAEKVDKELLDGIEARVKDMEGELKQRVDQVDQLKAEKAQLQKSIAEMSEKLEKADEKERLQEHLQKPAESTPEDTTTIEELRGAVSSLQKENEQLKETLQNPPTTSPEDTTRIEELRAAVSSLQKENEQLKETLQTLQTTSPEDTTTIEELRGAVLALQQENEHLKGVAKTQYEENVKYYEQFQAMAQHNQEIQDQLNRNNEQNEKRAKELARLREHLMIVEENSTREAVEAEHRETELRERVKVLEAKGHQVEEGASESNQQYQVQIASLTAQLESSQKTTNDWKRRFDSEQKSREQTQEALASLQNVVRELSIDHERDSATASHRNLELQTTISNLTEEIAQIREEMDRQSIGRQAAEEESERRQLQLESKQKIIEDLENQIEELRSPKKPTDSYRIDDSTLRQLFLSYFSSESSKKADIALLLANILEYPPDEMDKFKSAVRQSVGQQQQSSFWGLSARNSPSPSPGGSIADQFIRFLEIESESSRTAPHLPLRTQNEPAPRMSMDAPTTATQRSKNPQNQATSSSSSSAAALDSLLR
ncbi:hypothetical protein L3Y34_000424 [Caenorhabditis briggsae]|uniref:GRIP domain-containing protein n=2 Tax=Caenorhabditis briggsae TaxID=6238 RepID=A0AAE9D959_CAEBR|nr:hypothetical protein L3Y34_000424 [Caenorhabditis briggsae]